MVYTTSRHWPFVREEDTQVHDGSDPEAMTSVVFQLREIDRLAGWARVCAVGELILKELFGGSVDNWQTGVRERTQSLRRLAAHPDCPLKKSALAEAIGVYIFLKESPDVRQLANISPGHVALVQGRDRAQAMALLCEAEKSRLGVRAFARLLGGGGKTRVRVQNTKVAILKELSDVEKRLQLLVGGELDSRHVWSSSDSQQFSRLRDSIRSQLSEIGALVLRSRGDAELDVAAIGRAQSNSAESSTWCIELGGPRVVAQGLGCEALS